MFRDEVRDKQVYDVVADDYGILWSIVSAQLNFAWNTGMVIDANLAIIYSLTNFYIKNNSNFCHFYVWSLHIQILYELYILRNLHITIIVT